MGRNNSSIRVFFEEMEVIWSKCRFRMAFASKISFLLRFKYLLLENMVQQYLQLYCSLNYKTVALFKSAI